MTRDEYCEFLSGRLNKQTISNLKWYSEIHGIELYSKGKKAIIAQIVNEMAAREYGSSDSNSHTYWTKEVFLNLKIKMPENVSLLDMTDVIKVVTRSDCSILKAECSEVMGTAHESIDPDAIVFKM